MAQEHIAEVGPHVHDWRLFRHEGAINYQYCEICGTRRGVEAAVSRQAWLDGGEWDDPAAKSEPASEAAPEDLEDVELQPTESRIRRMRKDELIALADQHEVDHSDDPTNDELAERIIDALASDG